MKRTDLKPGQDYLVSTSTTWVKYGTPSRYRIVDMSTPYVSLGRFDTSDGELFRLGDWDIPSRLVKATGRAPHDQVVVIKMDQDGKRPRERRAELVHTRSIRGPWDQMMAEKAARDQARMEAVEKERKDRETVAAMALTIRDAMPGDMANRVGKHATWKAGLEPKKATLNVTLEDLAILLGVDL